MYPSAIKIYNLIRTELFGNGIIGVEFILEKVSQKTMNAQTWQIN